MLLTPFKWLLHGLDKSWKDASIHRQEKDGLIVLAAYYFLQIFLYQIATESVDLMEFDSQIKKFIQFIQIAGTGLGAVVGALILLRRRSNKWEDRDSIREVLFWYSIPLIISVLFLSFARWIKWDVIGMVYVAKFLFGFGWSVGIGCIIIWVCEYLPQFLRTSGAIYVGGIGFIGGALANLIGFVFPDDGKIWMPAATVVIAGCFTALWRKLPEDSQLNYAYKHKHKSSEEEHKSSEEEHKSREEEHTKSDFRSWFVEGFRKLRQDLTQIRQYRKVVIYSMFIGMGVQYYVNFVSYLEKAPKEISAKTQEQASNDTLQPPNVDTLPRITPAILFSQFTTLKNDDYRGEYRFFKMVRYLGMFIGGFFLLWVTWWRVKKKNLFRIKKNLLYNKRLPVITTALVIQLLLLGVIWITNGYESQFIWINTIFAFAIGLTCSVWPLCILSVAEQFSLSNRPIWVLLAPNAYRMADIFLLLMINEEFTQDDFKDLIMIGGMILALGILSSLGMEDNFDGDALYIRNNEPLNAAEIRRQIREKLRNSASALQKEQTPSANTTLQLANSLLSEHLTEKLKEQFFAVGLFVRDENDRIDLADVEVNPEAYEIYRPNKTDDKEVLKIGFKTAALLAASKDVDSLVRLILANPQLRGSLIMCSPKPYEQTRLVKEHYLIVNLQDFEITDIETHKARLENIAGLSEEKHLREHINAFKSIDYQISDNWEAKKDAVRIKFTVEISNGLERLFAFLRVDAERHFPWRYYLHLIQPYSDNSKVCMLIKTTVPLSTQRLDELHALLTFVELELVNKQLEDQVHQREQTIDKLFAEAEHNRKIELSRIYEKVRDLAAVDISASARKEMVFEIATNLQHLIEMAALHVALSRIENGITTPDFDQPEESDLIAILKDRWRDIGACVEFMNFGRPGHKEKAKNFLKDKMPDLKPEACKIKGHRNAIKVILFELLKNAVEKSDPAKPEINLQLTDQDKHALLQISNSIATARYDIMNREGLLQFQLDQNEIETPGRAGLRSVKRIMRFLNQQIEKNNADKNEPPARWDMEPHLQKNSFTLTIYIPKHC